MEIKPIFVEPLYQINLGYEARVLANFGIKKMSLVRPRCRHNGREAIKYSKHGVGILRKATIYKSIDQATKDCDIVVGTTGIWHKSESAFFNIYELSKAKSLVKSKRGRVALLIGRDDTGLTKEELQKCDFSIFIPSNPKYPVLNISHALAILLYELLGGNVTSLESFQAEKNSINGIVRLFSKFVSSRENIRDKKAVVSAFEHIVKRSRPSKKELNAISVAISDKYKTKRKRKN